MGIRSMSREKEENLIEISVEGHGCVDGIFECYGRFNTSHKFSCGFKPDEGWYRIADYTVGALQELRKDGIAISYSDTCKYLQELVEKE